MVHLNFDKIIRDPHLLKFITIINQIRKVKFRIDVIM